MARKVLEKATALPSKQAAPKMNKKKEKMSKNELVFFSETRIAYP
jgi:hypothetical protein